MGGRITDVGSRVTLTTTPTRYSTWMRSPGSRIDRRRLQGRPGRVHLSVGIIEVVKTIVHDIWP